MTNKTPRKRLTRAEAAARQQREYDFAFNAGKKRGHEEAMKVIAESDTKKLLEAKIRLAQSVGQMVEATARAVIAFCGEVGLQR